MKNLNKKQKEDGQSLIEIVVAVAVLAVVVIALIGTTSKSNNNSIFAKNQASATKYAQERIENIRNKRFTQDDFFTAVNSSCGFTTDTVGTNFTVTQKCTTMTINSSLAVGVTVTVTWTDAVGTHKSDLQTVFSEK